MKYFSFFVLALFLMACDSEEQPAVEEADADQAAYAAFFENMAHHCGEAFEGRLMLEPPGDDMLDGDELLVVHFRECEEDHLKIPFHIENLDGTWDRSRTWNIFLHEDGMEIRHDHRKPDGTEDDFTWYGGPTHAYAGANRMEFISHERTEETGQVRGWRLEIVPGEHYTYGTTRDGEWSWQIRFDLSNPVEPPPAPWGHS